MPHIPGFGELFSKLQPNMSHREHKYHLQLTTCCFHQKKKTSLISLSRKQTPGWCHHEESPLAMLIQSSSLNDPAENIQMQCWRHKSQYRTALNKQERDTHTLNYWNRYIRFLEGDLVQYPNVLTHLCQDTEDLWELLLKKISSFSCGCDLHHSDSQ